MTYPVTILTLDSARSYVTQGAPFTQGTISIIPIGGNISLKGFLLPILLLVVIIVMVVIVAVILVVVIVDIVGVVIVVGNPPIKASISFSVFGTMFGHKVGNSWNLQIFLFLLQEFLLVKVPIRIVEEYEDEETEDGPVDYPMDGEDDGDDDDDDSSGDDANDEEEEEEEHLAPADFAIVIPTDELVSLPKGTEPVIPPPSTDTTTTRARIIRLARCTAIAALPSPPLLPSLYPPPPVDRRDDIPESKQPPRKRLCLSTLGSRYEVGESSTWGRGANYGFTDTVEAKIRH
nr:hypothetical protein [Tanacetum cinerariifolium]